MPPCVTGTGENRRQEKRDWPMGMKLGAWETPEPVCQNRDQSPTKHLTAILRLLIRDKNQIVELFPSARCPKEPYLFKAPPSFPQSTHLPQLRPPRIQASTSSETQSLTRFLASLTTSLASSGKCPPISISSAEATLPARADPAFSYRMVFTMFKLVNSRPCSRSPSWLP